MPDRRSGGRVVPFLFLAALIGVLVAWMPTSYSMVRRWMGSQGYYSHGLLVPVISMVLIWMRREALKTAPIRRGWLGLVPLGLGVVGQLASAYANVAFSSGFSMLLVLIGLVWFVYGWAVFRLVAFPLCFLGFMVPLYMELLEQISFPMKMRAAAASAAVLRELFRVQCVRVGSTIHFAHTQVEVGDPCSGLRSLIALMALGALVAYSARLPMWRRLVLFAASIPFALAGNVVRITVLALVAYQWGSQAATGDLVHYGTGFLVFFVAVVLLGGLWGLLRVRCTPPGVSRPGRSVKTRSVKTSSDGAGFPVAGVPRPVLSGRADGVAGEDPAGQGRPGHTSLRRAAVVLLAVAFIKAFVTLFLLEDVAKSSIDQAHVAAVRRLEAEEVSPEVLRDHLETIRLQRIARGTLDTNYVLFTLIGLPFLLRGFRWARWYFVGLAAVAVAADVLFADALMWFLPAWVPFAEVWRFARIEVPPASAGVGTLVVGLHLVVWSALSAASALWTVGRLGEEGLRRATDSAAFPREAEARGFAGRATAGAVTAALLAGLTWWLIRPAPMEAGVSRASNTPLQIGQWRGEDFEPEPVVFETLETTDILSRAYQRYGMPTAVQLSVVFSRHNRRATHPPEICLKGSGWETESRRRLVLDVPHGPDQPTTPFVELVSKSGGGQRLVTFYAFKAGTHYTNRYLDQQARIFVLNVAGRSARGALVRFSAAAPDDPADTREVLIDFMRQAMPLIEAALEGQVVPTDDIPRPQ